MEGDGEICEVVSGEPGASSWDRVRDQGIYHVESDMQSRLDWVPELFWQSSHFCSEKETSAHTLSCSKKSHIRSRRLV